MSGPVTAFDALAADYDATFSETVLGRLFRARVWQRAAASFEVGGDVLELNCGTGVDAVWLAQRGHRVLATDASAAMLAETAAARDRAGLSDAQLTTRPLRLEDVGCLAAEDRRFDAVLSNFGGLNCVADHRAVLQGMAAVSKPGARALLGVMGPVVPWEWAYFAAHAQPARALRRLRRSPQWRDLPLRYPRPAGLARLAASAGWTTQRCDALGALVPPPFAEGWAARHPRLLQRLERIERRWATNRLLVNTADHYLLELQRV